jgi:hypothetical protein
VPILIYQNNHFRGIRQPMNLQTEVQSQIKRQGLQSQMTAASQAYRKMYHKLKLKQPKITC